ncbi:hypothetical protein PRZ48_012048 [Zasmidium cellare]|uniref:VOC domain-containing protein n=1 Tax=Zasmidium cellare TaxID=395010 RepID=A0ABR0E3T6_ZASCE|nr:hypothetical protein PRZ48_012048 [Zasmidium cellare]
MPVPHIVGTDHKQPAETAGYSINHLALIVSDIKSIRHFYGDILGLRHIVTHEASPTYQVTYMGHPTNEAGFQTGEELLRNLRYRDGLIEFLHSIGLDTSKTHLTVDDVRTGGFFHLGFVVPDVRAAEKRLKEFGVPILRALRDSNIEPGSDVAKWWGLDRAHDLEAIVGTRAMKLENILLVTDPEGNVVEIVERE